MWISVHRNVTRRHLAVVVVCVLLMIVLYVGSKRRDYYDVKIKRVDTMTTPPRMPGSNITYYEEDYPVIDGLHENQEIDQDQVLEELDHDNLKYLQPDLIPAVVHFVWCGQWWFEFRHYLSVKSVVRVFRPDKIVFHYDVLPVMDRRYYNQWFEWLKTDFEFLYLEEMSESMLSLCSSNQQYHVEAILQILNYEGGLYLGINTILTDFSVDHRKNDFVYGLEPNGPEGFLLLRRGMLNRVNTTDVNVLISSEKIKSTWESCCTLHQYINLPGRCNNCLVPKVGSFKDIKPMDIWERSDPLGRLVRKIFYNTEKILTPQPSYDNLVSHAMSYGSWVGLRLRIMIDHVIVKNL